MANSSEVPPPPYNAVVDARENLALDLYTNLTFDRRSKLPTDNEILVHLRLLHAFSSLRSSIWNQNGLFNLFDEDVTEAVFETPNLGKSAKSELEQSMLAVLRQQRWKIYVTRAVDRFSIWWNKLRAGFHPSTLKVGRMMKMDHAFLEKWLGDPEDLITFRDIDLPPLDVLMVWHAYMLHPRCFLEECLTNNTRELWRIGMPWAVINACFDTNSETYNPNVEVRKNFEQITGLTWANTSSGNKTARQCPNFNCRKSVVMPYSVHDRSKTLKWAQTCFIEGKFSDLNETGGYADTNFRFSCPNCNAIIDHNYLRAASFVDDFTSRVVKADGVANAERPMRGTALDADGRLRIVGKQRDARMYPNTLLRSVITDRSKITNAKNFESIQTVIERAMGTSAPMTRLTGLLSGYSSQALPFTKLYVDRMISRYKHESSHDLIGAVLRQGSFIDRMESLNWLSSAVLRQMMSHFIQKYQRFFGVISNSPDTTAVPTFEIDLCWHTHQLSPLKYYEYSTSKTKKFIDHDDEISETSLRSAFVETSKTYLKLYNQPYSECQCLYCCEMRVSGSSGATRPSYHASNQITSDNPIASQASVHLFTSS